MEQYLLCILNNALSEKDRLLIRKYLNSLFPSSFQSHHIKKFNESISILLKPVSKYIAVLNACETNEHIIWKLLNEDANFLSVIECEVTKTDSAHELDSEDGVDCIRESLHSLADQLPAFGTYTLDILIGSDVLRELSVRKEPSLAGAFIRLSRWHSADFTLFEQQEFDVDRLNEWLEIMNGQVLHSDEKCQSGPSLWRGSIQFTSSNNEKETFRGFQLKLDANENENSTISNIKECPYQNFEHTVISSKLQLFDEVSFVSIPSYLITPVSLKLHFNKLNVLNVNSSNFVEYLLSNKKVAFIAKLGYSELKERSKPERKYSSRAWEKAASFGDVKDAECFVSSFEKFITFAITKSHYANYVVAHLLRDSASLDASFYFALINHRISSTHPFLPGDKNAEVYIDGDSKYQPASHKRLRHSLDSKNGHCSCKNIDFSFLNENNCISSICSQFDKRKLPKFSFEQLDPSDWPERIELLQKQMKNEGKDGFATNVPVVQNLKLPYQSYSLSSETITRHFHSSGEGKNLENCENINLNSNSYYIVNSSLDHVLQMKWPSVMNCIYHDLYYNKNDQMEDKENLGSQLVNLYVQQETVCTCNNQQMIQNYQITVSERIQSPSKAFRGPSSRLAIISNEIRETSPSPRKNNLRELITKKILSTSTLQVKNVSETKKTLKERTRKSSEESLKGTKRNSEELKKMVLETSKRNSVNKDLVPVRCSPRKKNPISYKYPSVNKNNENKNADSSKMPDMLRMKLRCAVAKALEENGISGNHKLYQPCGAKLLTICRTFLDDLKLKKGKTSAYLQKIADAHVKQVIEFYKDS